MCFPALALLLGWHRQFHAVHTLAIPEEQFPAHPVSSVDHLEAERVLVSRILDEGADLFPIVFNFSCGCALLLAFHREDVPLLGACLPVMDDDIGPDGVVFAIHPDMFEVHTLPVEFDVHKQAFVDPEHGKEGGLKMVGQPVIDTDLVQLGPNSTLKP
jgi:hypothetical protein